jgi:hypothetical protein
MFYFSYYRFLILINYTNNIIYNYNLILYIIILKFIILKFMIYIVCTKLLI